MKKKAPENRELTSESQAFFNKITADYQISDEGGRAILLEAARCLDRISEARAILKKDGLILADRWAQKRPHPAHKIEADSRAGFISAMRLLGLDGSAEPGGK
jgi:hypothetical protein